MATIQYPLINGLRHDFSSCEINFTGKLFNGIKSIDYSHTLEPGVVRGNRAQVIGRTRGEYSAEGSMEIYLSEWDLLAKLLVAFGKGLGLMEVSFPIVVAYSELPGSPIIVDSLEGCRITKIAHSGSEGSEAATKQLDLSIMKIKDAGQEPMGFRQTLK